MERKEKREKSSQIPTRIHFGLTATMSIDEEMIFCLVHEIVDDIFTNCEEEAATSPSVSAPASHDMKYYRDEDDEAFVIAQSIPQVDVTDVVAGPSANKRRRRRLGVSSGAHDQIVLLRNNLEYVTEDRDRLRRKYDELELVVRQLRARECNLEEEISRYMRIIRSQRTSKNDGGVTTSSVKMDLLGPSGDSVTTMQNEQ